MAGRVRRLRHTTKWLIITIVAACNGDGGDNRPVSPYAPWLNAASDVYPDLSTAGPLRGSVAGLARLDSIAVDGVETVRLQQEPSDSYRELFYFSAEYTTPPLPGFRQLRARGGGGELTGTAPLTDAGYFLWTLEATPTGRLWGTCAGWIPSIDGMRRICAGDTIAVEHYVQDPQEPLMTGWTVLPQGFWSSDDLPPSIGLSEPASGQDVTAIIFSPAEDLSQTLIWTVKPGHWWPGVAGPSRVGSVPETPMTGADVWHGNGAEYLLVSDGAQLWAHSWNPRTQAIGEGTAMLAAHYMVGVLAADLDRDGADEMVITASGSMTVFKGDPQGGFTQAAKTTGFGDCALTQRQWRPTVEDLDGDGTLDVVATRAGGGIDIIYTNPDGTFAERPNALRPECARVNGRVTYATAARLDKDRRPYVVAGMGYLRPLFYRVLSRDNYVAENWRAIRLIIHANTSPYDARDVDGDGCLDLLTTGGGGALLLWRRPAHEAEDGLFGPRPIREITPEELFMRPAYRLAATARFRKDSVVDARAACAACQTGP